MKYLLMFHPMLKFSFYFTTKELQTFAVSMRNKCFCHYIAPTEIFMNLIRPSRGQKTRCLLLLLHILMCSSFYTYYISFVMLRNTDYKYTRRKRKKQMWEGISEFLSTSERSLLFIQF